MHYIGAPYFGTKLVGDRPATVKLGTIVGVIVVDDTGTRTTYTVEESSPAIPRPVKWKEMEELKLGQRMRLGDEIVTVHKMFVTYGDVWVEHQNKEITEHKYFDLRWP